jgi:hypothetical protein
VHTECEEKQKTETTIDFKIKSKHNAWLGRGVRAITPDFATRIDTNKQYEHRGNTKQTKGVRTLKNNFQNAAKLPQKRLH